MLEICESISNFHTPSMRYPFLLYGSIGVHLAVDEVEPFTVKKECFVLVFHDIQGASGT